MFCVSGYTGGSWTGPSTVLLGFVFSQLLHINEQRQGNQGRLTEEQVAATEPKPEKGKEATERQQFGVFVIRFNLLCWLFVFRFVYGF